MGDDGRSDVLVNFRALFRSLPTAYLVMSPDLVIVEANDVYLDVAGRSRDELMGRAVFDVFPPGAEALDAHGRNPLQVSFERARDGGHSEALPLHRYDVLDLASGDMVERFWSLITAPVLDDDGETRLILARVEDVTDYVIDRQGRYDDTTRTPVSQRRGTSVEADLFARTRELQVAQQARDTAARRLASLADIALRLADAGTEDELARILAGALAVVGADAGLVVSRAEHGWRISPASPDEGAQPTACDVPYDSPLPVCWTARTGRRLLLPTRASGIAFDESMRAVYEDTRRLGWASLPLTVQDQTLGALAVGWAQEHPFTADGLALLDGLAAQCAQTLQRIRATREQRESSLTAVRMSETLQRSLLTQPPTPDSLRIAVRYQPAVEQAQVGGDWYDAFVNATGSTVLVIGDVAGHDRNAAAAMGQTRNVLRGIAYDSSDRPASLLARLDAALRGLQLDGLATAVLARVEQDTTDARHGRRLLRWSNAGHPPPLLRDPDGGVRILDDGHDLLLGVDPATPRGDHVARLLPGSTLLLYTDGLVERRDADIDDGIARLIEVFTAEQGSDPETLCDVVLAALGHDGNDDDIALLVLHVDEQG